MRARKARRRSSSAGTAIVLGLIAVPVALVVVPFGMFVASVVMSGGRPSWLGAAAALLSFGAFVVVVRAGSGCTTVWIAELLLIPAFLAPILWIGNTVVQWIVIGVTALVGYPVVASINAGFLDGSEPSDDIEEEREASMRMRPGDAAGLVDPQDEHRFGGFQ